jgi:uncharacterized membrane protein
MDLHSTGPLTHQSGNEHSSGRQSDVTTYILTHRYTLAAQILLLIGWLLLNIGMIVFAWSSLLNILANVLFALEALFLVPALLLSYARSSAQSSYVLAKCLQHFELERDVRGELFAELSDVHQEMRLTYEMVKADSQRRFRRREKEAEQKRQSQEQGGEPPTIVMSKAAVRPPLSSSEFVQAYYGDFRDGDDSVLSYPPDAQPLPPSQFH